MNRLKIRSKSIALALVCAGIPATLVAQPREFEGAYLLKIEIPGVPFKISAFSMCTPDGRLKEIDYEPTVNFFGFGGLRSTTGFGHWYKNPNGQFVISYTTQLPNGQLRKVDGITTLSASGNEVTGSATVTLVNQDGSVLDSSNVTVTGEKAQSRLAAKP